MTKDGIAARIAIQAAQSRLIQATESGQDEQTIATLKGRFRDALEQHWPVIDQELTHLATSKRKGTK